MVEENPQCWRDSTPLFPAGHLPRKGGDWQLRLRRFTSNVGDWRKLKRLLISPLAGEMSGRTEGGVKERCAGYPKAH
ncbi:conserved hypothetical protein [Mesorhizobium sp. STM 4661]|nr:conserved hypothetical protein [Mesorhizobium sp. STM 4661]